MIKRQATLHDAQSLINWAAEHGGFTLNPNTFGHANLTSGYMVASASIGEVSIDVSHSRALHVLRDALNARQSILPRLSNDTSRWFIGGWMHQGNLVIDVSERIPGLEKAIATGRARNQMAIYDLAGQKDLPL